MHIGFVGLGKMGAPMATRLTGRHHVFGYSRSGVPDELISAGVVPCQSLEEVARRSQVVILMVPDTKDVEAILFEAGGLASALDPGKMVIDMSSISAVATRKFGQAIEQAGSAFVDAPVSGGEIGAREGTLTIMAGGSAEGFARAAPLLALMGASVSHVGAVGSGQIAKMANQIIVAATIAAVGEALVFASKAGTDSRLVRKALLGGFAASRVLDVHGERMINRDFTPGFRIELHRKDLALALDCAREVAATLPVTSLCHDKMSAFIASGGSSLDHSALVLVNERE